MNNSDSVRRWVHQKHGMSLIVHKFHSIKKCTYLAVPGDVLLYRRNNKTYDLQFPNSKNNNQSYGNTL